jgi:multicomponent Na+:H+ antiporter subunit D
MARSAPVIAALFLVPALSLIGVPPLSGFVAKFALVDAAVARSAWGVTAAALVVSLLTTYSLMKIWVAVFWSPAGEPRSDVAAAAARAEPLGGPALMVVPTAVLAAATLAIGLASGPLYDLSLRAAADLLDPAAYLEAVGP